MSCHTEIWGADRAGYGICESQQTIYTKDGDASFSVLLCSPVESFDGLPGELVKKTIPPGKYAVFTHRGPFSNLYKTYQFIFGTWLPSAKEELDEREDFEVCEHPVAVLDDPDNEMKIYIPIK